MLDLVERYKPDGFLFGGDQFHNNSISPHTEGKPLYRQEGSFLRDQVGFDKEILKPLDELLKGKEKVWLIGNHDRWEREFCEQHAQLSGITERQHNLHLVERGWQVVQQGKSYRLGKLRVMHGDSLFNTVSISTIMNKCIQIGNHSLLCGHHHTAMSMTRVSELDNQEKYQVWVSAALCKVNPVYVRNKPNAWINGLTLVDVMSDGTFTVHPVNIFRGKFSYGGEVYGAK